MTDYLFNQQIMGADQKTYRITGRTDESNILMVTPVDGNGGALEFCTTHSIAYGLHDTCLECRTQVREAATEASVTSCDTPEIQPN